METQLKCLVIDDEPIAIEILEDYISNVPFLEHVGSFRSALKALAHLQVKSVHLIFLDIKMPDISGIQFLKSLADQPLVIFTTAHSEFAVESYEYQAVDYLLKPIEFDRFLQAANRALKQYRQQLPSSSGASASDRSFQDKEGMLLLKSGSKYHSVLIDDILYIEGAGNYSLYCTKTKKIMVLMNLKTALHNLPSGQFVRVHKSYIVNLGHIDTIGRDRLRIGADAIPIGESYKKALLAQLKL